MTTFEGEIFEEIYIEMLHDLQLKFERDRIHTGRGDQDFVEHIGLSFELLDPRNRFVWNAARDTNYEFAMKMWLWIINGCDDFAYVGGSNPNAKKFIDAATDEERQKASFNTAYGPRIKAQLPDVIGELIRNPGSRRATINILDKDDKVLLDQDTKTEFPCIETVTFLYRYDKLHCHVNARSNNMFTTIVYDVFVLTMLQEYVYEYLRRNHDFFSSMRLGSYFHHATSAHIFLADRERIKATVACRDVAMTRPEVKA
jgi:thymidylate synthase